MATSNVNNFHIRPAREADFPIIRSLVRQARINPTGLKWERFVVAEQASGEVISCGQIKSHADGSRELASIVVAPEWRGQGLARAIIQHLLKSQTGEIYLMCRSGLGEFYQRFGFSVISPEEMPPYFRRILRLSRIWMKRNAGSQHLLVMKREHRSDFHSC